MMPPDPLHSHRPTPSERREPTLDEFFELRLALARVALAPAPSSEELERVRQAMREIARNANHAVRSADVSRPDDAVASACFAARTRIADARELLARQNVGHAELALARRTLYRSMTVVAEGLASMARPWTRRALDEQGPAAGRRAPLFPAFAPLVTAATRANPLDLVWILEVADAEVAVASAQPDIARLSSERRGMLRELRGEVAAWTAGARNDDAGYALLNRLVLLVDCSNH